jgi:hypothetical protein
VDSFYLSVNSYIHTQCFIVAFSAVDDDSFKNVKTDSEKYFI